MKRMLIGFLVVLSCVSQAGTVKKSSKARRIAAEDAAWNVSEQKKAAESPTVRLRSPIQLRRDVPWANSKAAPTARLKPGQTILYGENRTPVTVVRDDGVDLTLRFRDKMGTIVHYDRRTNEQAANAFAAREIAKLNAETRARRANRRPKR